MNYEHLFACWPDDFDDRLQLSDVAGRYFVNMVFVLVAVC